MIIQQNVTALNAYRNLTGNNSRLTKNLEKLSSGYRINRAGDDAAGLAISEKMRAQIAGLETAQKNAEDGVSLIQTAEGALTEVHSMLNRMVELATQSANGTYSSTNRAEMQKEIDALNKEINRISATANFNGTTLFSNGVLDATTGKVGAIAADKSKLTLWVGETSKTACGMTVTLKDMSTSSLGEATINAEGQVELKVGGKTLDDIDITTADGAKDAVDIINGAIDLVSSLRSDFGALQNRLEHTINNLGVQNENITAAESRIRGTDMAEMMMEYTKNNILVQASQAMLAQANQVPQGVLQLLQ